MTTFPNSVALTIRPAESSHYYRVQHERLNNLRRDQITWLSYPDRTFAKALILQRLPGCRYLAYLVAAYINSIDRPQDRSIVPDPPICIITPAQCHSITELRPEEEAYVNQAEIEAALAPDPRPNPQPPSLA